MLKKTITYEDFDGNKVTEDLFFNLSKSELMEMQLKTDGGLEKMIEKITDEEDNAKIVDMFKEIILSAYGSKSADGKHFRKSEELRQDFYDSAAYDALFMELISNPDSAAEFVSAIIPKDISEEVQKSMPADNKVVEMKPNQNN